MDPVRRDRWAAALLGLAALPVAYLIANTLPHEPVLLGTVVTAAKVPSIYQATVGPAFVSFCAALGLDVLGGRARQTWVKRAGLVLLTGGLSILRIAHLLPVSGHGLFLSAALAHDVITRAPWERLAFAAGALVVVAGYKLAWGDSFYFAISLAMGSVVGVACAYRGRMAPGLGSTRTGAGDI